MTGEQIVTAYYSPHNLYLSNNNNNDNNNKWLLSVYYVSDAVLSILHVVSHLIPPPWVSYHYYPHFRDKETEVQKDQD